MNPNLKRYRQTNLFESFSACKKLKSDPNRMTEHTTDSELFMATDENTKSEQSDCDSSTNVCQAAEDSVIIKIADCEESVIDKNGHCEDSVINKNENQEDKAGASVSEIDSTEMQYTDESLKYSDDLFPTQTSLEDYSGATSSGSAELFPNSDPETAPEDNDSGSDSEKMDDLSLLNRMPDCSLPVPKLEPSANHSIMFKPYVRPGDAPRPYPSSYRDKWDTDHVRMPCSPLNRYPVEKHGEKRIESRWDLICRSLRSDIWSSEDLEAAIMKYNSQYIGKWNFQGLHAFINQHWDDAAREHFFDTVLPAMIEMALKLPDICTQPVPLLKSGKDHFLTMSQKQIGCLLLNAFFCTFPRRTAPSRSRRSRNFLNREFEYISYPDINFNRLFSGVKDTITPRNAEKLKCLLNYFKRITSVEPCGTVTFHRQYLQRHKLPTWKTSNRGLRTAVIKSSGLIEIDGEGMLQVDFANKYVGGGVLGHGCVQEEIRFVICPELIVTRLFVERLDHNEVLIVKGVEQYNKYSGYSDTFKWEGNFRDETPRDDWGRRYTELLAMDATPFRTPEYQFKCSYVERELDKAYVGFYEDKPPPHLPAVATGNWGCGAFKGNANLKFLIQLMAASQAGRGLVYFTFGNKKLRTEMKKMYDFLSDKNLAIGDIWRLLMSYARNISSSENKNECDLYEFIYSQFVVRKENSKQEDNGNNEDQHLDDSEKKALSKLFEDIDFGGSSTEIENGT